MLYKRHFRLCEMPAEPFFGGAWVDVKLSFTQSWQPGFRKQCLLRVFGAVLQRPLLRQCSAAEPCQDSSIIQSRGIVLQRSRKVISHKTLTCHSENALCRLDFSSAAGQNMAGQRYWVTVKQLLARYGYTPKLPAFHHHLHEVPKQLPRTVASIPLDVWRPELMSLTFSIVPKSQDSEMLGGLELPLRTSPGSVKGLQSVMGVLWDQLHFSHIGFL